jgi:hypothetical protein
VLAHETSSSALVVASGAEEAMRDSDPPMPTPPVIHEIGHSRLIATLVTADDRALGILAGMSQPESTRLGIVSAGSHVLSKTAQACTCRSAPVAFERGFARSAPHNGQQVTDGNVSRKIAS